MKSKDSNSIIYKHHIEFVKANTATYGYQTYLDTTTPEQMVVDYMASMTDDYFVDLYEYLFPDSSYKIEYVSYFE